MSQLLEEILSRDNMMLAYKKVKANKGASGIDGIGMDEMDEYLRENWATIKDKIRRRKYKPQPVRRVEIPKPNGGIRNLGIPTVVDRIIEQAIVQKLTPIVEPHFSEHSYGFRPGRRAQQAVIELLEYFNDGYTYIVDIDLEKFFDNVPQDKLMTLVGKMIHDPDTESLIRKYLNAGVMVKGKYEKTIKGTPQGGNLSPLLSNIMLNELDKELEARGLNFVRYADDCVITVRSSAAANRVMNTITRWIEKRLGLKVNVTKTKVTTPNKLKYLGFGFWCNKEGEWKARPHQDSVKRFQRALKQLTKRSQSVNMTVRIQRLNWVIRGWINYFRIGAMKVFMDKFGQWLRHKIRVILVKQWKKPECIYKNLQKLNKVLPYHFTDEQVYAVANARLGLYRQTGMRTVNFLLSAEVLAIRKGDRPGLVNPLTYYLR